MGTIGGVNTMQKKCPQYLPKFMRTWEPLRSLAPYDKFFTKYLLCCCSQMKQDQMAQSDAEAIEIGASEFVKSEKATHETVAVTEKEKEAYDNEAFTKL